MNGDVQMREGSDALDLGFLLRAARRRLPLVLLCAVVVSAAAFAFSKQQTKQYTSTASLIFNTSQLSQELVGLPGNNSNLLVQQAGNVASVQLGDMAAATAQSLGHGLTEASVKRSLSIGGLGESNAVGVSATSASPVLAAQIANTYATQFVKEQQAIDRRFFQSALALVEKQLAALSPRQRLGPSGVALQNRAQSLKFLAELQGSNVRLAQEAAVPTSPSSPKTSRNTIVGFVLGLLLGFGLAILLERLAHDRRITDPEDLERIYDAPLLGTVPESSGLVRLAERKSDALRAEEAEVFHLIRAHLRSLNSAREPHVVLIASPASGEGRTTIARQLAEAAERLGSRVLLLEADLRRPGLAKQYDVDSRPSLSDVLAGRASMRAAVRSLAGTRGGERFASGTLDLLPGGATGISNAGALIDSHAMGAVLEQARLTYDFVVVDAPPLAAISDAFPLLGRVDGVIVVGRIGRSRRDLAQRLQRLLLGSGASVLGTIANGARAAGLPTYVADATPMDVEPPAPAIEPVNGATARERIVPPTAKV